MTDEYTLDRLHCDVCDRPPSARVLKGDTVIGNYCDTHAVDRLLVLNLGRTRDGQTVLAEDTRG